MTADRPSEGITLRSCLLLGSAWTLGWALQVNNGHFHHVAAYFLVAAVGTALLAAATPPERPVRFERFLGIAALIALVTQVLASLHMPPGIYLTGVTRQSYMLFLSGLVLAAAGAGTLVDGKLSLVRRVIFPALLVVQAAMCLWILRESPRPFIDVFVFLQDSAQALASGINPYTIHFPNIYGDNAAVYGEGLSRDGVLQFGYPYPILSLLPATLAWVTTGDSRVAHALLLPAAAAFIAYGKSDRRSFLAATLLLFTPRIWYIMEQSWIEPQVVFWFAALYFCMERAPRLVPIVLGLLLASKQYCVLFLPLVPLLPRNVFSEWSGPCHETRFLHSGKLRVWLVALGTAALATVPPLFWDFHAFIFSVGQLQFLQPFRPDALSFPALLAQAGIRIESAVPAFLAAGAAAWWSLRSLRPSSAGFATGAAVMFLLFFAFNKQAFANYYLFVIALLCTACAAGRFRQTPRDADPAKHAPPHAKSRSQTVNPPALT
jgi:hypothetical protein